MPITISQNISINNKNNIEINGTFSTPVAGVSSIEIFQNNIDQGAATLNDDGTWSFDAFIPGDGSQVITAVLTDPQGKTTTSDPLQIVENQPLPNQIASLSGVDDKQTATIYNTHGRALYDLTLTRPSDGNAVELAKVIGRGPPSIRYGEFPGSRVIIQNFHVAGPRHDTLTLSDPGLQTLADVLRHTTVNGGVATIHSDLGGSITLTGVTKHQIATNPNDFVFTNGPTTS